MDYFPSGTNFFLVTLDKDLLLGKYLRYKIYI
jgi:hypothetical protein